MIDIILTKGVNTDDFIPADIRTTIRINTDITGPTDERLFTTMVFDNIEPWQTLRNWYPGEVMPVQSIIAFCALTGAKAELFDGVETSPIYDPAVDSPGTHSLVVEVHAATGVPGSTPPVLDGLAIRAKGFKYGASFETASDSTDTLMASPGESVYKARFVLPISRIYVVEVTSFPADQEFDRSEGSLEGILIGDEQITVRKIWLKPKETQE